MYHTQHLGFGGVPYPGPPIEQELRVSPAFASMVASQSLQETSTAARQGHQKSCEDSSLLLNACCYARLHLGNRKPCRQGRCRRGLGQEGEMSSHHGT